MRRTGSTFVLKGMTCLAAGAALAAVALAPAPVSAQTYTMKISTAPRGGDQIDWMKQFKANAEKRSGGRLKVQLYPGSQLSNIRGSIEGMQLGTIESWIGPPGFLVGVDSRFQAPDAPGVFADLEHAHRTLTDPKFRDVFLALGEKKGVKGISLYASNLSSVIVKKKPIRTIEDFKGLKLRVLASKMETESMRRLGAAAIPMNLMEALPALQRGAIDGVKSALVIFIPFKYWGTAKHITETDEGVITVGTFISKSWYDKLPPDLQRIVVEEGRKLEDPIHEIAVKNQAIFRKIWTKNGGKLYRLSASDQKKLMAKLATVGATVVANDPGVKKVYDLMLETARKNR